MTAKEYLLKYKLAESEINIKIEQIKRLKDLANSTTVSYGGVKSDRKSSDKIGEIVAKMVDLEDELMEKVDELVDLQ